jgi:hypothetical protein
MELILGIVMPTLILALTFTYMFLIILLVPFDLPGMLPAVIAVALAIPTSVGLLWLFMEKILPVIWPEKSDYEKRAGNP